MIIISMPRSARFIVAILSWVVVDPCPLCFAQPEDTDSALLPLSSAFVEVPGAITINESYSTVEWEGKQHHAVEGTNLLMKVIKNPVTDGATRANALQHLGRLRNRGITTELISIYESLNARDEKLALIRSLIWSKDSRGFELYARVLEHEKDNLVRLTAATALAQWNVRLGVSEMVGFLEKCMSADSHDRVLCNEAAKEFLWCNAHKGWGFPEKETRKSITETSGLDDVERAALFVSEMKKWWAENEHRFPEWKPGDPLPEIEPLDKSEPPKSERE